MMQDQSEQIASDVPGGDTPLEPFARLVRLVGRAFYDDLGFKGEELTTCAGAENHGLAVVILDALTRYQWVEEDELARSLHITKKKCLSILRYFEAERFLKRKIKSVIRDRAAATGASGAVTYWCLDYPKICDIIRFKLITMKQNTKCQFGGKEAVHTYICRDCKRRYSSFDVIHLPSSEDYFQCENCSGKVMEEIDELSDAAGDGRKRRKTAAVDLLIRMEEQLAPLVAQLDLIAKLPILEFTYLDEQDLSASIAQGAVRCLEETTVEASPSLRRTPDDEADANPAESKILPDWMIKEGMLRKTPPVGDDSVHNQDIKDAYVKAYCEAWNKSLTQKQ